MRVVRFDTLAPARWANDGGTTREIAAERDELGILWRVSLAEVEANGPFSIYPGLTRILTVVSGSGMELATPAGLIVALPLSPVRFAGALPVMGRLLGGPVRDLNLMLRGGCYRGQVMLLGETDEPSAGLRLLNVVSGQAFIGGEIVASGDTVIAPEGLIAPDQGAVILDIRIIPDA